MRFTWEVRQLKTAAANGKEISYAYNSDGVRIAKTVDGVTTSYLLDGSNIIAQKTGDDILWFLYDSDGTKAGFTYDGAAYYYAKNAQGDVTGIVDSDVNPVVEYSYDPWGKLLSTTGSMADTIGRANPFLYRGYCYDAETGLYYLNSRYYDPRTGRFLNVDGQLNPDTGLIGNNLFAYCNNNPAIMSDSAGNLMMMAGTGGGITDSLNLIMYQEHTKNKRKSTEETHQKGQARNKRDSGGEKGDVRRTPNPNKRRLQKIEIQPPRVSTQRMGVAATLALALIVDDTTLVGIIDDIVLVPILIF